ncbi:MAG: hypothetical protein ABIV48_11355 [Pyrinomonadaceae bacterium]
MAGSLVAQPVQKVNVCSSLKDDRWHNRIGPAGFESWHFDAVSDDGREALVITFYDNYPMSPRFYEQTNRWAAWTSDPPMSVTRFPAISFVYSVDGITVLSAVNEMPSGEFASDTDGLGCKIGDSSFRFKCEDYGKGFFVTVDIGTVRGRRIHAELEWLFIESDLAPPETGTSAAVWNMVAPRSDVSGRISLIGVRGKTRKLIHFRGSGYHDSISSDNERYRDLSCRTWGRGHFVDSTVVFDHHGVIKNDSKVGKMFIIRDGEIRDRTAAFEVSLMKRDRWGLAIPRWLSLVTDENVRLNIRPVSCIRSGFSDVKMLSEFSLDLNDGKVRKTIGITECFDPRRLKNRLFRMISDLEIGRDRRSPIF